MSSGRVDRRIEGFETIRDIVKALSALSALQLRRATAALDAIRLYELDLRRALASMRTAALEPRAVTGMLTLVFGTDQGLCGGLNRHVAAEALSRESASTIIIGAQLGAFLAPRGEVVQRRAAESFGGLPALIATLAEDIEKAVVGADRRTPVDGVEAVHPIFARGGSYSVGVTRIFPVDRTRLGVDPDRTRRRMHEPESRVAEHLLAEWTHTALYWAALETLASVHGARLDTTDGATNTVDRRLESLRLERNRLRQAEITEEVQEVLRGTGS